MGSDFNQNESNDDSQVTPSEITNQVDLPTDYGYLKDGKKVAAKNPWAGKISFTGVLAWLVVIAFTIFLCVGASLMTVTGGTVGGDASPMDLFPVQMQAKALIGQESMKELANLPTSNDASPEEEGNVEADEDPDLTDPTRFPDMLDGPTFEDLEREESTPEDPALEDAIKAIDSGPYEQRLCTAIVISELKGPGEAIDYLGELDKKIADSEELELTDDQKQLRGTIGRLMHEYESGSFDTEFLADDEKELLAERLQWLGELALVPVGTSDESGRKKLLGQSTQLMIVALVIMLFGILVLGAGLAVAIVLLAFLSQGRLQAGFENRNLNHNIYIETFAVWMILFFGSSIGLGFLNIKNADTMMFLQPIVFFGSLVALVWPVIRGIPFAQVRQDIGWTAAKPVQDAGTSVLSYLSTLPLMIPAFALMFILMAVSSSFQETSEFARGSGPGHPIQEYVMTGNATMIALIFFAVCVCAPVVEETMFRGVLYRHLRELSGNWKRWASVLFAAILNGIIFASCHPQGIFGVPLLATLAVGFSFAREWRGSLISPMIMHAIHNGMLTCIMLFIL